MSKSKSRKYSFDESSVPAAMPFPSLKKLLKRRHGDIPVPALNAWQTAYLHATLEDLDLSEIDSAKRDQLIAEALQSKAFTHVSVDKEKDKAEEAQLPQLIADLRARQRAKKTAKAAGSSKKNKSTDSDDEEDKSDTQESITKPSKSKGRDVDALKILLRGYPMEGWKEVKLLPPALPINKLIDNKCRYRGRGQAKDETAKEATMSDVLKLLQLIEHSPRKLFIDEKYDEIFKRSKAYGGANAGVNFRLAAKAMWEEADAAEWEARFTAVDAEVTHTERMETLRAGLCEALSLIQNDPRFPAFAATLQLVYPDDKRQVVFEVGEVVPKDALIAPGFRSTHGDAYNVILDQLYDWAAPGLKALSEARGRSAETAAASHPVFALTAEELEQTLPRDILPITQDFLMKSFEYTFGTREVPWDDIKVDPEPFCDAAALELTFPLDNPSSLPSFQRMELALALSKLAGPGTQPFFRKVHDNEQATQLQEEAEADAARLQAEKDAAESARLQKEAETEAARLQAEKDAAKAARLQQEAEADAARLQAEKDAAESARLQKEAARLQAEKDAAEIARLKAERDAVEEARLRAMKDSAQEEESQEEESQEEESQEELRGKKRKRGVPRESKIARSATSSTSGGAKPRRSRADSSTVPTRRSGRRARDEDAGPIAKRLKRRGA
ncbi:hypothetical protein GGX14DRAFT_395490 [Mycena pura]|uniref:Uncharacterized protein n=1 Tax=Mycena pura TaxID=153505 RepID=A0AAD6VCR4_9AGAR|nr:hypothetical protein GGX14DRAFT_395490 [Mycena pura]